MGKGRPGAPSPGPASRDPLGGGPHRAGAAADRRPPDTHHAMPSARQGSHQVLSEPAAGSHFCFSLTAMQAAGLQPDSPPRLPSTHAHSHSPSCTCTHSHASAHSNSHPRPRTLTLVHTRTHTLARAHTDTRTRPAARLAPGTPGAGERGPRTPAAARGGRRGRQAQGAAGKAVPGHQKANYLRGLRCRAQAEDPGSEEAAARRPP